MFVRKEKNKSKVQVIGDFSILFYITIIVIITLIGFKFINTFRF